MKTLKQIAYGKYQLDWMMQHGYTLEDLIREIVDYMDEVGNPPLETYWMWEQDSGFNGEIWVDYDEFLENEYKDVDYMKTILDDCDFEQCCREELK